MNTSRPVEVLFIVGLVRSAEKTLDRDLKRLSRFGQAFQSVEWCIVESDSDDSTADLLDKYRSQIPNFSYVSLGKLEPQLPERIQRIAHCRNVYVEHVSARLAELQPKNAWVMVVDLDDLNRKLSPTSVLKTLSLGIGNAYFPNQLGPYYDIYALRHPFWMPDDCFRLRDRAIQAGMSKEVAEQATIHSRMITINPSSPPFRVASAFGGVALYKASDFAACTYRAFDDDGQIVCEHVQFNKQMESRGSGLWIVPSFINAGLTNHTVSQAPLRRALQPAFTAVRRVLVAVVGSGRAENLYRRIRSLFPYL